MLQNIPLTPDGTSVVQLDLSSLPDGLYLLQVVSGEFKTSTRVMKQ
ncbi:MAG: T9SS type A sorting domain-containing protein [Bacteroidetes bacterium]|nr:T9SS type A sorting domain-containing protein [Bacteroidota bacterium]